MIITDQEWRDLNDERRFPFSDDATLRDDAGGVLPLGAFVDAVFYPINTSGMLYLSKLDLAAGIAEVSDASTKAVAATGTIGLADSIDFLDNDGRPAGVLVKGDDFNRVLSSRTFQPAATTFAAACMFPQNQLGVRAFKLPDGTLVSGDVEFVGENGCYFTVYSQAGDWVLRLDALGVNASDDCIQLPPPVKCLRVSQVPGSLLTIHQVADPAGTIYELGAAVGMADLCPAKRIPDVNGVLPVPPSTFCPTLTPTHTPSITHTPTPTHTPTHTPTPTPTPTV